jgi:putative membrane protein
MKKTSASTLFLCLAAAGASAQMTNQGAVMPEAAGVRSAPLGDAEFVRRAAIANRFEIAVARLALAHGSAPPS